MLTPITLRFLLLHTLLIHTIATQPPEPIEPIQLTSKHILATHSHISKDQKQRHYPELHILGFATPWNPSGEQTAITQAARSRLDTVSTVTYTYKLTGLHGGDEYSSEFYDKFKSKSDSANLMPRVMFDTQAASIENADEIIKTITEEWKKQGFHGVVLEIWQTFMPLSEKSFTLMKKLGKGLLKNGLQTALVLPPYTRDIPAIGLRADRVLSLKESYTYFIAMTYDYSNPKSKAGPISPASWVQSVAKYLNTDCGLQNKLLLGLNFYGVDFVREDDKDEKKEEVKKSEKEEDKEAEKEQVKASEKEKSNHVVGSQVLKILKQYNPRIEWQQDSHEHFFQYFTESGVHRAVFYPTRTTIAIRLRVARDMGCGGVAIWDLGQGLDHFFEEF